MTPEHTSLQATHIQITDFKILKEQIESAFEFDESQVQSHESRFGFEMSFDLELKLVKTDFRLEITTESAIEQPEAQGLFHFAFVFWVENLHELANWEEGSTDLAVDPELGQALASMTYATARGILMARLQGTVLRQFILPTVDVRELL